MKPLNKMIALFLVLLVSANTVFASQMASTMIIKDVSDHSEETQLPCHEHDQTAASSLHKETANGEEARHKKMSHTLDCCDVGCATCVSGSVSMASVFFLNADSGHEISFALITPHLAAQHAASLYRPPILI